MGSDSNCHRLAKQLDIPEALDILMEGAELHQIESVETINNISSSIIASRLDHLASAIYPNGRFLVFKQQDSAATTSSNVGVHGPNSCCTCPYVRSQATKPNGAQPPTVYKSIPGENFSVGSSLQDILRPYLVNTRSVVDDSTQRQNLLPEEGSSARQRRAASFDSSNSASSGTIASSRKRIRWTKDLHEKFLACIDILGGSERATPKAILKLMGSKGLTTSHVKSHLQKFRSDNFMSEHKKESVKEVAMADNIPELYKRNIMEIKEAIKLQLDVEKDLSEQLQIQRNLQLQIEENGRQLKMMLEQQQRANKSLSDSILAK